MRALRFSRFAGAQTSCYRYGGAKRGRETTCRYRFRRAPTAEYTARRLARRSPCPTPIQQHPTSSTGRGQRQRRQSDLADTRLTGIVTEPGHHVAIFAVNGAKPLRLSEGEAISGWRIESITPREVSLSGPSGTKTLEPKLDPNLAQPAAPTPPPNPAAGLPTPPQNPAARVSGQPGPGINLPPRRPAPSGAPALPRPARVRPQP